MREDIRLGKAALQPAGQQIDRQRKAVHLSEEGDEERRKRSERSPVPLRLGLEEAEGEENEDSGIDENEPPKAIRGSVVYHY